MEKGFKVFRSDWTCSPDGNTKQYCCPGIFEDKVSALYVCRKGMHFCKVARDCFNHYPFNSENHVAEVIAHGNVVTDGDKSCTDKLEIVREVPWSELLEIVNIGKNNTGHSNTGDSNTGDSNTGDSNTGYRNTGDYNVTNRSCGVFCQEPQKVKFFDIESDMTFDEWRRSSIYNKLPCELSMDWWNNLSHSTKILVSTIPNWDEAKFILIIKKMEKARAQVLK